MPVAENCHIGAPAYTVSVFLQSSSVAGAALFHSQKKEWWSEVVVGQGLNEVQAHPSHTEKVTDFPELHDTTVFILKSHI